MDLTKERFHEIMQDLQDPDYTFGSSQRVYSEWNVQYDKYFAKYFTFNGPTLVANKVISLLGSDRGVNILDLGSGTGRLGQMLHEKGFLTIDALDANQEMLAVCRSKGIYRDFICQMLGPNKLEIPDDAYDVLVLSGVFMPNHADHSCFPEVVRILKPGGYFVFAIAKIQLSKPSFRDFEECIDRLQSCGSWRCVCREEDSAYSMLDGQSFAGIVYALQKL